MVFLAAVSLFIPAVYVFVAADCYEETEESFVDCLPLSQVPLGDHNASVARFQAVDCGGQSQQASQFFCGL